MTDRIDTAKEREKLAALEGHTPGPWSAIRNSSFWEFGVYRGDIYSLGDVCATAPESPDEGGQEANAKLIAAAPDLLATIHRLLDALDAKDAEIERMRAALGECESEIDLYIWQEYPSDHPVHETYRQRDLAANPARAALNPEEDK